METKLTLRLDKKVIAIAKDYARKHKISLSGMVESYNFIHGEVVKHNNGTPVKPQVF